MGLTDFGQVNFTEYLPILKGLKVKINFINLYFFRQLIEVLNFL